MKRITQYQRILRRRQTVPLAGKHPVDPVLRHLLVHAVFADAVVAPEELETLSLLIPEMSLNDLRSWVEEEAARLLDTDAILTAFPLRSDRFALLQLVRTMVAIDGDTHPGEDTLMESLTTILLE
jgi:hypothetical protein